MFNRKYSTDFAMLKPSDIVRNHNNFGFLEFKSEEERYNICLHVFLSLSRCLNLLFNFSLKVLTTKTNLLLTYPFLIHFASFRKISLNCEGYGACKEKRWSGWDLNS